MAEFSDGASPDELEKSEARLAVSGSRRALLTFLKYVLVAE